MTAPTPLLPDSIKPASIKIKSQVRSKSSQSMSGRVLTSQYGGQWYQMTLSYRPMTRAEFGEISAFLASQNGRHGIFYVEIDAINAADAEALGNYVNFDDHDKVYQVTGAPAASNVFPASQSGSGNLRNDGRCFLRCSLVSDVHEIRMDNKGLIRFEIDVVERLV